MAISLSALHRWKWGPPFLVAKTAEKGSILTGIEIETYTPGL